MKLFEYEAKNILSTYGIPIPNGGLATSPEEARQIALQLKPPYAIKAQVLVAGRGKAGGILFAGTPSEVADTAQKLLKMKIKGVNVKSVLVEEKIPIKKELYFGITIDRVTRSYVVISSTAGGMDIEEVSAQTPEKIFKLTIDPLVGFRPFHARQIALKLEGKGLTLQELSSLFLKFYQAAMDYDAELMEMNPLVETVDGKFVALDARLIVDDNALFRHQALAKSVTEREHTELSKEEVEAAKAGLAYVKLDGDIGIIGNGAGLVMATLDSVALRGGKPANFLDVGGGASIETISKALTLVLNDSQVKAVFINILGGITRCDDVAKGILKAYEQVGLLKPLVIRLVGTNEAEGKRILTEASFHVLDSMEEAAEKVVRIVKKGE